MSLALLFFILRLLQQCNSSRVPQPMKDTLEEQTAEEVVPRPLVVADFSLFRLLLNLARLLAPTLGIAPGRRGLG